MKQIQQYKTHQLQEVVFKWGFLAGVNTGGFLKEVSFVLNFEGWAEKWRLDRTREGE